MNKIEGPLTKIFTSVPPPSCSSRPAALLSLSVSLVAIGAGLGLMPTTGARASGEDFVGGHAAVSSGSSNTIAVRPDGTVWTWGSNSYGELGNGTFDLAPHPAPLVVPTITGAVGVAAGGTRSFVLEKDGSVWGFGNNAYGELGTGGVPQGNSWPTEQQSIPEKVVGLSDVVALTSGDGGTTTALKSDGTVWQWGQTGAVRILAQVPGLANVVAISSSAYDTVALESDGTVWAWGDNRFGQLGSGTNQWSDVPLKAPISGVISIASELEDTLVLKSDGSVWGWGANGSGELGDGSGYQQLRPVRAQISNVVALAGGSGHTMALTSDGHVWAWGWNIYGQAGLGGVGNNTVLLPQEISSISRIVSIAAGTFDSFAIDSSGAAWGWGRDDHGELGNGSILSTHSPSQSITGLAVTPTPRPPGAPANVQAAAGYETAILSWAPPSLDGGRPITGFTITCTPTSGSTTTVAVGPGATTAVVASLQNGLTYTCSVVATNAVGSSPPSASVSVTPSLGSEPRQIVFVHGINGNAAQLQEAMTNPNSEPKRWQDFTKPLAAQFGAGNVQFFRYYQDFAYLQNGTCVNMPPPDTSTATLWTDRGSVDPSQCDSKGALAYSATALDDFLAGTPGPTALVTNSLGGAVTRGWLALVQTGAPGRGLRGVDTVISIQGAQEGSWIASAGEAAYFQLWSVPIMGPIVNQVGRDIAAANNFDPLRPGIMDVAADSPWYGSVNPSGVPASLNYYNFYSQENIRFQANLGFWTIDNALGNIGDTVMLTGSPNPTDWIGAGGARFLPAGSVTNHREFPVVHTHTLTPVDFVAGLQGVIGAASSLVDDSASHFNYDENVNNASAFTVDSCNGLAAETTTQKILDLLASPAAGCTQ